MAEATKQHLQSLRAESNIHAMDNRRPRQHANRGIIQPTTAQLMMEGLRKINDTVVSHNSVTVLTVIIVVDNVEGFKQTPSKIVPLIDLRVADVAKQTTG